MNATSRANLWKRNRTTVEQWMNDYGKRTGKSNDEIIAERQAHWIHDERARKVGNWEGYEMSVCPINGNQYRYTVVTPWGMNEGLCDLERRNDYAAAQNLFATIAAM